MHLSAPNLWEQIRQSRIVYAGKMFQIGSSVVCQVKTTATVPETQVSAAVIKHCSLARSGGEGLFQLSAYCETQAGRSSRRRLQQNWSTEHGQAQAFPPGLLSPLSQTTQAYLRKSDTAHSGQDSHSRVESRKWLIDLPRASLMETFSNLTLSFCQTGKKPKP